MHNNWEDQPYSSMLLVSPYCDFKCNNCHNIHLSKETIVDFPVDELVEKYNANPFYKGITLAGLEPSFNTDEFFDDLYSFIEKAKVEKVTIYTRLNYDEIPTSIGLYNFIRNCIIKLDNTKKLYLKTGAYIDGCKSKTVEISNWKIKLASQNQQFITIKNT